MELLDQAGEWYLDRHTGVLSYWPRPGEDMNETEAVAPVVQNTLLAVVGTPQRPVVNLHFQGLHIEHVDWPLPAWGYMGLFCCNVTDGEGYKPGHRFIEAAVEYQHARQCSFKNGGIAHVGAMGICLRKGTASIAVEGNEIHDLGGGGIGAGYPNVAAGYLEAAPPPEPGEYRDYRIANNYVHHCGTDYYGAVGILLFASQDSVVAHNLIHDTAYFGIGVAGSQDPQVPFARNNTVEYNHIHHAMKVTVDGAGLYVTFAQADPGCLIRGNVVHDQVANHLNSRPLGPYSAAGIYLDMANSGCRYEQNVVYQTPWPLFPNNWRAATTSWRENVFLKTGTPPAEFLAAVQARAGLEPAYRRKLLKQDAPVCHYHIIVPADASQKGWSAGQFDMPGAEQGVVQVFRESGGRRTDPPVETARSERGRDVRGQAVCRPDGGAQRQGRQRSPDGVPRRGVGPACAGTVVSKQCYPAYWPGIDGTGIAREATCVTSRDVGSLPATEDFGRCGSDRREAMIIRNAFSISTVLLMASLAVDGSLSGALAAEPSCTETCGPTRTLGVLKPGKPVPLEEGFRDPTSHLPRAVLVAMSRQRVYQGGDHPTVGRVQGQRLRWRYSQRHHEHAAG